MVEAARLVMGTIDVDPATSERNHTRANVFYTIATDGLSKPWVGNVLLNPPYGIGLSKWMHKLNEELASGRVTQAICFIPVRTSARWFRTLCGCGATLCFPKPIKFVHGPTGKQKDTAWMPIVIVYIGHRHEEFAQNFREFGLVTKVLSNQSAEVPRDNDYQSVQVLSPAQETTAVGSETRGKLITISEPKRPVLTLFWACPRPMTKHWGSGRLWDRICKVLGTPDAAFGKTDGIPEGVTYYDLSNGYDWRRLPLPDNYHEFGYWDPPYDRMYRQEAMEIWRVCKRLAILHPQVYPKSWFAGGRREAVIAITFGPFKVIRCLSIFTKEKPESSGGRIATAYTGNDGHVFPKVSAMHVPERSIIADVTYGRAASRRYVDTTKNDLCPTEITQPLQLFRGDCLTILPSLPDQSIDLVLTDLPSGVTACEWDSVIPLDKLWHEYRRVAKDTTAFIFTATQPFTTQLINSCMEWFRYELIWEKPQGTNPFNAKKSPLKAHENIVVFYKKRGTYNPQMEEGRPYSGFVAKNGATIGEVYGHFKSIHAANPGVRYPKSVLRFKQERGGLHPTQKPTALMEYLIATYSNEGDTVLDNCMGSGTTGLAAMNMKRHFIGIERDRTYFSIARTRTTNLAG
jgi:site-specific DNA-methyltransferase (adenine-specific)